ncbi:hypothetical protein HD554DRAFT_2043719 [Boletus coccyginus]|nr:hypothetical protein HD554DRAFT_2043719 [Boletus coccyginus]
MQAVLSYKGDEDLAATLEKVGDTESHSTNKIEALMAYSSALLLGPTNPNPNSVLTKWARLMLSCNGNVDKALRAATQDGRLMCAITCFTQMQNLLPDDASMDNEQEE